MASRRGNGEGSIYRRADGRWVGSLTHDGGRRKSFYAKTRQEVAVKLAAALKARQDGLPIPGERQTIEQFLNSWLEGVRPSLRPTTWERYETLMRLHVFPAIGRVPLPRLAPDRLQRLYRDLLQSGLSAATARQVHAILRKALNDATRWGLAVRNVAALTSAPKAQRREMLTLAPDEVRRLLDAATHDGLEALYVLAVTTGMRQGEILALRWRHVDLDHAMAQVRSALHRTKDGFVFDDPKTTLSRRQIALTQAAIAALRRHRAGQAEQRLKIGAAWKDDDLVFTNEAGGPIDAGNLRNRSFWPLLKSAGLPRIRFHDLRHTAATLMLGRGIHPKVVSEMLGHSQIGITLDLYSHVTPTMQREAAGELDRLLGDA